MRIAIFSDVHANLEALKAVLAHAEAAKCEKLVCLGDIVGYGPNPRECLNLVRERNIPCVMGNHDDVCGADEYPYMMNSIAQRAILWTQQQLSDAEKSWLRDLPYLRIEGDTTFVHSSLEHPETWEYVTSTWLASRSFAELTTPFAFIGHTHEPIAWIKKDKQVRCDDFDRLAIQPETSYIINVGSVGQPRDGDPRASYVIHDSELRCFDLKRVPYDLHSTQQKIISLGLPVQLAERLTHGW